ncbi:MAG TPA: choice-of-anchor Q domain-containing protein [Verrucomicrobiae bacterium]
MAGSSTNLPAVVFYVDIQATNPVTPYASWSTAATNIQVAVDVATNGDLVWVNDGIYQTGWQAAQETQVSGVNLKIILTTNRLFLNKPLTVQSLHGPQFTTIDGGGIYRCAYLTNGAILSGFTLTHGLAGYLVTNQNIRTGGISITTNADDGGGAYAPSGFMDNGSWLSNCLVTGNVATGNGGGVYGCHVVQGVISNNVAVSGGGAYAAKLVNCVVIGNAAQTNISVSSSPFYSNVTPAAGGGLYLGTATNCLIIDNSAYQGGGVYGSYLVNCTAVSNSATVAGGAYLSTSSAQNCLVYYNRATTGANILATNFYGNYCCTYPLPTSGTGNITNEPLFLDLVNGNFQLAANSPCINAGSHVADGSGTDLAGLPRVTGGTVDIGAYEYPAPTSVLSYAWAQQYGFPTDGSMDFTNLNGTVFNVYQDWVAGLNPTNPASILAMLPPTHGAGYIWVRWQSVSGRNYFIQRSSDLTGGFVTIQTNVAGVAGTATYLDAPTNSGPFYYRVGVQ